MNARVELTPGRGHIARLMSIWRSAGWPSRDAIELDLLAAGLVTYAPAGSGGEVLQVTEAGLRVLAATRRQRQSALGAHARLTERVCADLVRAGRIVWRELSVRTRALEPDAAAPAGDEAAEIAALDLSINAAASCTSKPVWRLARPDVFSVRHTSVEAYLQPTVHEVKVKRADLLADLRNAVKGTAYRSLSCETYYVFPRELADPAEIPEPYGVVVLDGSPESGRLETVRPARHRPCQLPFTVWMALAKATPVPPVEDDRQRALGEPAALDAVAASWIDSAPPPSDR